MEIQQWISFALLSNYEIGVSHSSQQEKKYVDLQVKFPIHLFGFNQIWNFSPDFRISLQDKISQKSIQWEPRWYMRIGRRADKEDDSNRRFSRRKGTHIKMCNFSVASCLTTSGKNKQGVLPLSTITHSWSSPSGTANTENIYMKYEDQIWRRWSTRPLK